MAAAAGAGYVPVRAAGRGGVHDRGPAVPDIRSLRRAPARARRSRPSRSTGTPPESG